MYFNCVIFLKNYVYRIMGTNFQKLRILSKNKNFVHKYPLDADTQV